MVSPYLALIGFAVAASFTPGPNNAMLAASAATHGLRATLPQVLGVAFGFAAMLAIVGLGIAATLRALPLLAQALRLASFAWLVVLAVRIARAGAPGEAAAAPLGFLGAVAFQWINPKGWFIALAASATFTLPGRPAWLSALTMSLTFLAAGLPSALSWAALGGVARRWLGVPWRLRAFNIGMATLMVASMLPVAFEK